MLQSYAISHLHSHNFAALTFSITVHFDQIGLTVYGSKARTGSCCPGHETIFMISPIRRPPGFRHAAFSTGEFCQPCMTKPMSPVRLGFPGCWATPPCREPPIIWNRGNPQCCLGASIHLGSGGGKKSGLRFVDFRLPCGNATFCQPLHPHDRNLPVFNTIIPTWKISLVSGAVSIDAGVLPPVQARAVGTGDSPGTPIPSHRLQPGDP